MKPRAFFSPPKLWLCCNWNMFGNKINPPQLYQGQTVPLRGPMSAHRQRVDSPSLTHRKCVFRNHDCRGQRLRETEQLASHWSPQCLLILAYFIFLANAGSISLSLFNTSSFLIISVSRSIVTLASNQCEYEETKIVLM